MDILRKIRNISLVTLVVYSTIMICINWFWPASCVRYFLTDIVSSSAEYEFLPLYAVNTSLSVFLLWAGAVLFMMAWRCLPAEECGGREETFLVSQMLIFFYLGCDDRFLIHEGLSDTLGMKDALFFGALGLLELFFLLRFGRLFSRSRKIMIDVILAGFFFGIMFLADVVMPYRMKMHLSIEDIAKLWSAVFLFKFAWDTCSEKIERLKGTVNESP